VELLGSMQDAQPQAREFLTRALEQERDPEVLAQAAASLHPQAFMDPQKTEAVTQRLHELRQNADAKVRNAALGALATWEGEQAIEKDVLQGMQSANPDTVVFSIQTALQAQLKSTSFRDQLFAVIERGDLPLELRRHVVELLGSSRLTQSEYQRLMKLREQL
jgi:hypothetical protein